MWYKKPGWTLRPTFILYINPNMSAEVMNVEDKRPFESLNAPYVIWLITIQSRVPV